MRARGRPRGAAGLHASYRWARTRPRTPRPAATRAAANSIQRPRGRPVNGSVISRDTRCSRDGDPCCLDPCRTIVLRWPRTPRTGVVGGAPAPAAVEEPAEAAAPALPAAEPVEPPGGVPADPAGPLPPPTCAVPTEFAALEPPPTWTVPTDPVASLPPLDPPNANGISVARPPAGVPAEPPKPPASGPDCTVRAERLAELPPPSCAVPIERSALFP